MVLKEGIYLIEKGYRAIITEKGKRVEIVKRKDVYGGLRCRDCKFCKVGKYVLGSRQWWESAYCEKKSKTVAGDSRYFYSTKESNKACAMVEPREV